MSNFPITLKLLLSLNKLKFLIVDSKDRDWSGESSDPLTFDYTVKFAPSSDLGDAKGQARLAHFLKNFKNIYNVLSL